MEQETEAIVIMPRCAKHDVELEGTPKFSHVSAPVASGERVYMWMTDLSNMRCPVGGNGREGCLFDWTLNWEAETDDIGIMFLGRNR